MARPPEPIFLERQSYRRRRLADAARFLPWLGAVLLVFPALWGDGTAADPPGTASRGIYVFAAWAVLVAAAGLISRRLVSFEAAGANEAAGAAGANEADGAAGANEADGAAGPRAPGADGEDGRC